jgi:hypothetical protein
MIANKQVPTAKVHMQQWRYCWKQCFLQGSVPRGYKDNCSKNSRVRRELPFRQDLSLEAEE